MSVRNIALGFLVFTLCLSSSVGAITLYNMCVTPDNVYINGALPAFSSVQDYSDNTYASLIRLETKDGQFFCSGTVISDDYVLTAAHCLMRGTLFKSMTKDEINVVSINNRDGIKRTTVVHAAAVAANVIADYALIKGDFKKFTKTRILVKPNSIHEISGRLVTCGFPWGAEGACYATGDKLYTYFEVFKTAGHLYPGMSGGPVVDSGTKAIFAVNTGATDGFIVISPLIGLFETLGVQVIE